MSKLHKLYDDYGQSVWLDYIDRDLLIRGGLEKLIESGVRGVTVNPTIFHKAVTASADYDTPIRDILQKDPAIEEEVLYERLIVSDVTLAADLLEPVYTRSNGKDGFVSLEVSPHLAYDTEASISSARHLWQAVGKPNLMIKIPGTIPGLKAIEQLLAEGINVNVTLLFSVERYKAVTEAFLQGISRNSQPETVASVASFFVSRVDSKVDAALTTLDSSEANSLKGRIAIANAKIAYQHFKTVLDSQPFQEAVKRGIQPQRPLWASTSTKDPAYSDVLYIEQLIGANTVNTTPPETLTAFQDHGKLDTSLEQDIDAARADMKRLGDLNIDITKITQELEQEGVNKFADSYEQLLNALKQKRIELASK